MTNLTNAFAGSDVAFAMAAALVGRACCQIEVLQLLQEVNAKIASYFVEKIYW